MSSRDDPCMSKDQEGYGARSGTMRWSSEGITLLVLITLAAALELSSYNSMQIFWSSILQGAQQDIMHYQSREVLQLLLISHCYCTICMGFDFLARCSCLKKHCRYLHIASRSTASLAPCTPPAAVVAIWRAFNRHQKHATQHTSQILHIGRTSDRSKADATLRMPCCSPPRSQMCNGTFLAKK